MKSMLNMRLGTSFVVVITLNCTFSLTYIDSVLNITKKCKTSEFCFTVRHEI